MKAIELVQLQDTERYPIHSSTLGTNAYYLDFCNFGGHRPSYAACLSRIGLFHANEEIGVNCAECSVAISRRSCPALAMREEELEAGRALYYINRAKLQKTNDENLVISGGKMNREAVSVSQITLSNTRHKAKFSQTKEQENFTTTSPQRSSGSDYADAINTYITKTSSVESKGEVENPKKQVSADYNKSVKESAQPKSTKVMRFQSGLSLSEIAMQMKAMANNGESINE